MTDTVVRLSKISIHNFKNVKNGELNFYNRRKDYRASVLGLYGQNGSGKTALIDAVQLLKYILCGKAVPAEMADYINVDAEYASLAFTFDVTVPSGKYEAEYEFCIRREEDNVEQNLEWNTVPEQQSKLVIFNEVLSYSFSGKNIKIRKAPLIDTGTEKVFVPVTKYERLIGKDKEQAMDLLVAKKIAANTSRSFIFSRELMEVISTRGKYKEEDIECLLHVSLLQCLVLYGNFELFVIGTANTGMISMNALPLAFRYEGAGLGSVGQMRLPLEAPAVIPEEAVEIVKKVIHDMNIVLEQMIPGLRIDIKDLGTQALDHGKIGRRIQLMSQKNSREIPLRYESEGIKKIISILQLLIVIYNKPSITVAIDELDSGVFEYLLGEILRIISEKGKGQLIFTSHNLRPLETLDRGFIAFTTTNPSKRYIRMTNIKDNNNLRDFYFRDIVLGEQSEEVYEPTNNAEIAMAFREAGEVSGS